MIILQYVNRYAVKEMGNPNIVSRMELRPLSPMVMVGKSRLFIEFKVSGAFTQPIEVVWLSNYFATATVNFCCPRLQNDF